MRDFFVTFDFQNFRNFFLSSMKMLVNRPDMLCVIAFGLWSLLWANTTCMFRKTFDVSPYRKAASILSAQIARSLSEIIRKLEREISLI